MTNLSKIFLVGLQSDNRLNSLNTNAILDSQTPRVINIGVTQPCTEDGVTQRI